MKFNALIHSYADTVSYYNYVVDNEAELISTLKEESENCFEIDNMTLKEFEEEYYCDFDDYKKLKKCSKHLPKGFAGYSFQLSDMCTDLELFTSDLDEVRKYLEANDFDYSDELTEENISEILNAFCEENDRR